MNYKKKYNSKTKQKFKRTKKEIQKKKEKLFRERILKEKILPKNKKRKYCKCEKKRKKRK